MSNKNYTRAVPALLAVGLLAFVASKFPHSEDPLLTIERTSLPLCQIRTYIITPSALTVAKEGRVLSQVALDRGSSKALLQAISNALASTLSNLYDDPHTDDGFVLEFRFNLPGKTKTVELRNSYVRALCPILEECDKLLPPESRFTNKSYFVEQNMHLDDLIAEFTANSTLPEEWREKIIAQLRSKKVDVAE